MISPLHPNPQPHGFDTARRAGGVESRVVHGMLLLSALTSGNAFLTGFPTVLAIVPVAVLLPAIAVLVGPPFLARRTASDRSGASAGNASGSPAALS